jgi:demethylmenaquinone methyltransferase/2-methoxy-6-polyprenyl-1,4-benzoquinol methylase
MRNQDTQLNVEEKEYYALVKKVFDVLAPFYDFVTMPLTRLRDKVAEFANAKNGARVLDVATGTGKQAFAFAEKGYDVTGIDISEAMLNVANKKNRYKNVNFQVADATNLPFEDNSFDVSSVSFALHDMPATIREKVLKEIVRVTKPGGTIIIVDYALPRHNIGRFLIHSLVKLYEGKYYREFMRSDFAGLLRESGIEVEEELQVLFNAGRIWKGRRANSLERAPQ